MMIMKEQMFQNRKNFDIWIGGVRMEKSERRGLKISNLVQELRNHDVEGECHESNCVCDQCCLPSRDHVVWIVENSDSEDELCGDEIVDGTHCNDAYQHEPTANI